MVDLQKRMGLLKTNLNHPKIVCLCETWLTIDIPVSALFLNNFFNHRSIRWTPASRKTAHGGFFCSGDYIKAHACWHIRVLQLDFCHLSTYTTAKIHLCCIYRTTFNSHYGKPTTTLVVLFNFMSFSEK